MLSIIMVAAIVSPSSYALGTTIDLVPIGNQDNINDDTGFGAVNYAYRIGTFEVTASQYAEFLNAVAQTDAYGLYNELMWTNPDGAGVGSGGCRIERQGSEGSYTYAVAAEYANRPATHISWGDAARFCNWLHNGRLTGSQDLSTTEDGSYYLNGATAAGDLQLVGREADATWVIPTANEWYKAAYYDPGKPGGAGYWNYPTRTDAVPSNQLPDQGNNANYHDATLLFTIGSPYYRTEVGTFTLSESAYATFDQGGNVWEWTEEIDITSLNRYRRKLRGGSFGNGANQIVAGYVRLDTNTDEEPGYGFRVVNLTIPEPGGFALLAAGAVAMFLWRRRHVK